MFLKKMIAVAVVVASLGMAQSAMAWEWVTGTISQTGVYETYSWVVFTPADGSFTSRTYTLTPTNTSAMLATALTAQSAGKSVMLYVAGDGNTWNCSSVALQN